MTGITLAGEAFCGYTEHIHNEDCTEAVLICTEETSVEAGSVYSCGLDEHVHTSDNCSENFLVCTEEHEHTDDCYTEEIICEKTEHAHGEECTDVVSPDEHTHTESC